MTRLLIARPRTALEGEILIPPSKYHAHRALMLAALSPGTATIIDRTEARHVGFTLQALRALGADIRTSGQGWKVNGGGFSPKSDTVPVGSSGTTLYFLLGLAALGDRPVTFVGQRYFRRRPIGPLLRALKRMGVKLEYEGQSLPVRSTPVCPAEAGSGSTGCCRSGSPASCCWRRSRRSRRRSRCGELNERGFLVLTLEMMRQFGLQVEVREDWREFTIDPCQQPITTDVVLPPDVGSAMFGLAACALHPSNVTFRSRVPIHGHPEASVLTELQSVGVPMRFREDGLSIIIDHDGAPPLAGRLDCRDIPDMVPILSRWPAVPAAGPCCRTSPTRSSRNRTGSGRCCSCGRWARASSSTAPTWSSTASTSCTGPRCPRSTTTGYEMALAVAGSTATGVTEISYPYAYRISLPGVRRPHEHDRNPDRRHPAAAEFAGGFDIAGLSCGRRELILDHVDATLACVRRRSPWYEFSAGAGAQPRELTWGSSMRLPTAPRRRCWSWGSGRAMRSPTNFPIGSSSSQSAWRRCGSGPSASR